MRIVTPQRERAGILQFLKVLQRSIGRLSAYKIRLARANSQLREQALAALEIFINFIIVRYSAENWKG